MILDLIQIFLARRDTSLASKLALRFTQGQLLERATAPLLIGHLCLWGMVIMMGAIAVGLFVAAINVHGAIVIAAIIPLSISLTSAWVSFRLKAGLDRIKGMADRYSDAQIDRMFDKNEPTLPDRDIHGSAAPLAPLTTRTPNTITATSQTGPSG